MAKLKDILNSYLYGRFAEEHPRLHLRVMIINVFTPIALLLNAVYAAVSFTDSKTYWLGYIMVADFLVVLLNIPLMHLTKNVTAAAHILVALALPIQLPWLVTGGPFGRGFYFTIPWVPWAFLLLGRRQALFWVSALVTSAAALAMLDQLNILSIVYSPAELLQIFVMLFVASFLLFLYDRELEKTNKMLEARNLQLQEAYKELESFSYSISHDLRAPLRAIDGFSHILLEKYISQLSEEASRYLKLVRNNVQRMSHLIDDLLNFSRLSRQPPSKRLVDPADIVKQVLESLAEEQKGRQVQVIIGELPTCQADAVMLRQVFVNLISNALKFTRKREVAVIEIGCRTEVQGHKPKESIYFVKDNGVGFDMRYADKLFGVFQRLHRADEYEGTGVGLAIVQRVIHRHGGRIWAEAEVNKGATFYFTLEGSNS